LKGQLNVATPDAYIAQLEGQRRIDVEALDALIRKTAPRLKPFIMSGTLGYGPWHYQYASGREGDSAHIVVASNANYISLYLSCLKSDLVESYKKVLPKAKIGKCCVRFKKFADLDAAALTKMIGEAARNASGLQ
jgi:hypothetical protein